jgi:hypothetical protein
MAKWVAYTPLGDLQPGDEVSPLNYSEEDWNYNVTHGVFVRQGGPHDPAVLAGPQDDDEDPDPKDLRIRELERQLELAYGRTGTPAPGATDPDVLQAQQDRQEEQDSANEEGSNDKKEADKANADKQTSSGTSSSSGKTNSPSTTSTSNSNDKK